MQPAHPSAPISNARYRALIGGGAIARGSLPALDGAPIDPADTHDYQPARTLPGAGAFPPESTALSLATRTPAGAPQ